MAPASDDEIDTLDLLNDEVSARLTRQDQSGARIDTKATVVIGFAATAAQFLATRHTHPVLAGAAFTVYAIAFGCGIKALAVAAYQDVEPRALVESYARRSKKEVLSRLVASRVHIYEDNARKYRRKVTYWWLSVGAFTLGLVVSAAAIVQTA